MSGTTQHAELALYDYSPYERRPKIEWPNGARLAFWVAPNIEFYELDPPLNPHRKPWPHPYPAVPGYSIRDYGNRVGHHRQMAVLDKYGVRGSISLSAALCEHHPEIIALCAERNWEFFSHGIYNTRYTYGLSEDQEREMIEDAMATIERAVGQRPAGYLAPALSHSNHTIDLFAEAGGLYTCDCSTMTSPPGSKPAVVSRLCRFLTLWSSMTPLPMWCRRWSRVATERSFAVPSTSFTRRALRAAR